MCIYDTLTLYRVRYIIVNFMEYCCKMVVQKQAESEPFHYLERVYGSWARVTLYGSQKCWFVFCPYIVLFLSKWYLPLLYTCLRAIIRGYHI